MIVCEAMCAIGYGAYPSVETFLKKFGASTKKGGLPQQTALICTKAIHPKALDANGFFASGQYPGKIAVSCVGCLESVPCPGK